MAYHGFKPAEQALQIGDDVILSSHIDDDVIVNADINSSAAIATSKISGALTSVGSHGLATSATTDTTNASNISSGTLAAARVATLNQNTTGTAATVTTAAQPNITSVSTLTGLTIENATNPLVVGSGTKDLYFDPDSNGVMVSTATSQGGDGHYYNDASGEVWTTIDGTAKVKVKASAFEVTPNATFAGSLTATTIDTSRSTSGATSATIGNTHADGLGLYIRGASGTNRAFNIRDYTNNNDLFYVQGNGNATFAGDVRIGATSITASGDKSEFVVQSASHGGMSALGPDATEQGFFTGHASLNRVGEFHTRYDTNTMTIGSAKSGMQVLFMSGARATALTINASQHLVPASHLYMGITGSAGSPAIAFDTDADTGIYRKGTNELGFSTNGTERVYINDSLNVVGVGYFNEMIRISISDISSGENRGLQLLNTSGADQQWNITAGVTGSENESFCIRDSTANVNALTIGINSGVAQFAGNVTVDSDTMLVDSAGHGYCVVDAGSTSYATWVAHKMGGTTKYLVGMEGGASAQYRIYDSGDASVAVHITTTGNSWVADSDERMKKDITPMENRLDDLLKIKVRRFKWKHNDKVDFGFVAQELETCAPDAVEVGSDEVYSKEEAEDSLTAVEGALKNPYGVSREQLIPMMVKSIQELSDKLDTANAKITALENA